MSKQISSFPGSFFSRMMTAALAGLIWLGTTHSAVAVTNDEKAQTAVHMLDYVSVDYPTFVQDGTVLNPDEYEEQLEFATQSATLLGELPATPQQPQLLAQAAQLQALIKAKKEGAEVAAAANNLRLAVIQAYKLTVTPKDVPDLNRGAQLFGATCAACHGATGHGDGPLAKGLEPEPSNFHDEDRMRMRSIYGLYNTITLGVSGTPMQPYSQLPENDRWSLAFYVSTLRANPEQQAQGESLWQQGTGKHEFSSLKDLVMHAPAEIEVKGAGLGTVQTYLTAHPEAIRSAAPSPLVVTRSKLAETLQAYEKGDRDSARQLAISAYLEGFELVENSLNNVDKDLRSEVEREMMDLRAAIAKGVSPEALSAQIDSITKLLDAADEKLGSGSLSGTTAFISSLLILLREGLEAILVLAALSAFISKTGRRDALPYFHLGWIFAILLGGVTWYVASYLLTISGAGREMTEGITALVASAMLLYVGYWLHSKSHAHAWQKFISTQVTAALDKRTWWAIAGLSFLAVYRELFEVILFYEALWAQTGSNGQTAVIAGIVTAAVLLAILTWVILKYSVRLPLGKFFAATAGLLALLAVIFAGNGIAALQEAGVLTADRINFITVPLLGIFPTIQTLAAQGIALALVFAGMLATRSQEKH
ncbi:cytochrome c/FTR1 family iron permease [Methylobacillus gramineus]|uniref:cytochrome c/FTR1 family iron permease n=1 Tax=Methylobacillus gramineus TaxID=755169 RepID=UPI001D0016B9|nr:cytochrome c/FTR1 family iron permease [Methylobacillus gramineus]MCB5184739.1 cytochrome c/FTR1 family iron permease [Methylobacillus gramineus]